MKCLVCGTIMTQTLNKCPKCGCQLVANTSGEDNGPSQAAIMLANNHRQALKNNIKVSIKSYQYEEKDFDLVLKNTYTTELSDFKDTALNQIKWYDQVYAPFHRDLELDLVIVNSKNETKETTVKVKKPLLEDNYQIGIVMNDDFTIQIAVGNAMVYELSNKVDMI